MSGNTVFPSSNLASCADCSDMKVPQANIEDTYHGYPHFGYVSDIVRVMGQPQTAELNCATQLAMNTPPAALV